MFVAPATIGLFWDYGVFTTFLVCILKMAIAGLISGLLYKYLNRWNKKFAVVVASISVPIINTGLFAIAAYTIYYKLLEELAPVGQNIAAYLFLSFIGFNFLIEFAVNSALSPVVLRLTALSKLVKTEDNE